MVPVRYPLWVIISEQCVIARYRQCGTGNVYVLHLRYRYGIVTFTIVSRFVRISICLSERRQEGFPLSFTHFLWSDSAGTYCLFFFYVYSRLKRFWHLCDQKQNMENIANTSVAEPRSRNWIASRSWSRSRNYELRLRLFSMRVKHASTQIKKMLVLNSKRYLIVKVSYNTIRSWSRNSDLRQHRAGAKKKYFRLCSTGSFCFIFMAKNFVG